MKVMLIDDNLIEFDNGNRISTVGDDDGYGEVYRRNNSERY